jgi:hypothetical protein
MTHALTSRMPRAALGAAQALRAFPYAAFTLVIAVVLACGIGIADMPSSWAKAADVPLVQEDAPAAALVATAAHTGVRAAWGVVETITPLQPVADRPDEFEFTVRLRDRSARITRTVGRAKWHVGDRIMLMDGSGPSTD